MYGDEAFNMGINVIGYTYVYLGVSAGKPRLSVMKPFDGQSASVGNGAMVSLAAASIDRVQALHTNAMSLGGQDEGASGQRNRNFYGEYFRDLDGDNLAAFCNVKS